MTRSWSPATCPDACARGPVRRECMSHVCFHCNLLILTSNTHFIRRKHWKKWGAFSDAKPFFSLNKLRVILRISSNLPYVRVKIISRDCSSMCASSSSFSSQFHSGVSNYLLFKCPLENSHSVYSKLKLSRDLTLFHFPHDPGTEQEGIRNGVKRILPASACCLPQHPTLGQALTLSCLKD